MRKASHDQRGALLPTAMTRRRSSISQGGIFYQEAFVLVHEGSHLEGKGRGASGFFVIRSPTQMPNTIDKFL